jgi:hypothetical protein
MAAGKRILSLVMAVGLNITYWEYFFLAQNIIGFGTTVGSTVFNILSVIGVVNILS